MTNHTLPRTACLLRNIIVMQFDFRTIPVHPIKSYLYIYTHFYVIMYSDFFSIITKMPLQRFKNNMVA